MEMVSDIGDIVHYTIAVSNTGNIDLSSVVVTDTLSGLNSGSLSLTGPWSIYLDLEALIQM